MKWGDWVKDRKLSWAQAAELIGVGDARHAWRYAHGTVPRTAEMVSRIYLLTAGQVTPNDFYDLPELPASAHSQEAA